MNHIPNDCQLRPILTDQVDLLLEHYSDIAKPVPYHYYYGENDLIDKQLKHRFENINYIYRLVRNSILDYS